MLVKLHDQVLHGLSVLWHAGGHGRNDEFGPVPPRFLKVKRFKQCREVIESSLSCSRVLLRFCDQKQNGCSLTLGEIV